MSFYNRKDILKLLDIVQDISVKYSREDSIRIYRNLSEWVGCGSKIQMDYLKKVAVWSNGNRLPVIPDQDEDVKHHLLELYGLALDSDHMVDLLEAGIRAGRKYETLLKIVMYVEDNNIFEINQYIKDSAWSDKWITAIIERQDSICTLKNKGYDIMSILTPKHSVEILSVISAAFIPRQGMRASIEWLKDDHWHADAVSHIIVLYLDKPGTDWGKDVVMPWMCRYVSEEILRTNKIDKNIIDTIIDKWINVSPVLDLALWEYCSYRDVDSIYSEYNNLRELYKCDGDKLAAIIYHDKIPKFCKYRNGYYNECIESYKEGRDGIKPISSSESNIFGAAISAMGGD